MTSDKSVWHCPSLINKLGSGLHGDATDAMLAETFLKDSTLTLIASEEDSEEWQKFSSEIVPSVLSEVPEKLCCKESDWDKLESDGFGKPWTIFSEYVDITGRGRE